MEITYQHAGSAPFSQRILELTKSHPLLYQAVLTALALPLHAVDRVMLARLACMHPNAFSRAFRHVTGITFREFKRWYRISAAEELLRTTLKTVKAISRAAAYACVRTFRRHFLAVKGRSPRAYRAQFLQPIVSGKWQLSLALRTT